MEKFIVTTGKTIDLAVTAALQQLGMDRDSVSVEVLENAKSGFLGIGASPAKVKVTYEVPDEPKKPEAPMSVLSSASRSKPKERPEITSSIISRPGRKIEPEEQQPARRERRPRQERRKPQNAKTPSMKQTMKPTTKRPPKTPSMKPRSMPLLPTPSTKLPPTRFQNRGTHWWSSRRRRSCRRFSGVSRQTKTVGLAEELRTEWKRALAKLTAGVKCVKWCSNGTSHKTVLRVVRKGESFAVGVREDVHRRLNGRGRREC